MLIPFINECKTDSASQTILPLPGESFDWLLQRKYLRADLIDISHRTC